MCQSVFMLCSWPVAHINVSIIMVTKLIAAIGGTVPAGCVIRWLRTLTDFPKELLHRSLVRLLELLMS